MESASLHSDIKYLIEQVHLLQDEVRALRARLGKPLYGLDFAASELNCSKRTVQRMIDRGDIVPVNKGKKEHPKFTWDEITRAKLRRAA